MTPTTTTIPAPTFSGTSPRVLPVEGVAKWLARNPEIFGVGPAIASRFAESHASDIDAAFATPEALALTVTRTGLPTKAANYVAQALRTAPARVRTEIMLAAHDLTWWQIQKITSAFKDLSLDMVSRSPWAMVGVIPGIGFLRADQIALKCGADPASPDRARAAILHQIEADSEQGHTWTPGPTLVSNTFKMTGKNGPPCPEHIIRAALDLLVNEEVLIAQGERIALPSLYHAERRIAALLRTMAGSKGIIDDPTEALRQQEEGAEHPLNPRQRDAVLAALSHRVTIVTGGAGTGKTFIVRTLVEIAQRHGLRVKLAAPTGKAARRISEVVRQPAKTLHRLLEYGPLPGSGLLHSMGFNLNEERPIEADLVIVDEVSMVDAKLMLALLQAIGPETTLVLVGDHHQLPAVGPGAILRDLCANPANIPVIVLDHVVRQAGFLKRASTALLEGRLLDDAQHQNEWWVIRRDNPEDIREVITRLFGTVLPNHPVYGGERMLTDVQLLTPMKNGPIGVDLLNEMIQALVQRALYGKNISAARPGERLELYPGDKVIQTKNDYDLGIMNGQQAVIQDLVDLPSKTLRGKTKRVYRCLFDDGNIVDVPVFGSKLALAYALTVHKSQGSEYPLTIVVAHSAHTFMLHRNLIYTAATRARATCVLIGDAKGLARVRHTEANRRRTFLASFLAAPAGASL